MFKHYLKGLIYFKIYRYHLLVKNMKYTVNNNLKLTAFLLVNDFNDRKQKY